MNGKLELLSVAAMCAALAGCGRVTAKSEPKIAPAKVENGGIKEADLAKITLTPEAESRLGIETVALALKAAGGTRAYAGELVMPPGHAITVAAPVAGTLSPAGSAPNPGMRVKAGEPVFRLLPMLPVQRDLRLIAETEVTAAAARVENAKAHSARAERMLHDRVGSVRAQEDAAQELRLAETVLAAARSKLEQLNRAPLDADVTVTVAAPQAGLLRQVYAAAGQAVSAGAPLFEVARFDPLWVRVPVYTGEMARLQHGAAARIAAGGRAYTAHPIPAPPSADPLAATADLYFSLPNAEGLLRPGERVEVTLAAQGRGERLQAPNSAVLIDVHGGAWVYENTAQHVFVRRRVEVERVEGGMALLARGPAPGARIVTAGAAELFGTEFGAGK